jgi:hypothetical protein
VQIESRKRKSTMQINELIEKFLGYCARHRSTATLAFYRTRLKKY